MKHLAWIPIAGTLFGAIAERNGVMYDRYKQPFAYYGTAAVQAISWGSPFVFLVIKLLTL